MEFNKETFVKALKANKIVRYQQHFEDVVKSYLEIENQSLCKKDVVSRFSFDEQEPEIGAYILLVWEDGLNFECVYDGLDKSILPLPTHWYYV